MKLPEKLRIARPHDGLRLGYCDAKDCKHDIRVVVAEIRLSTGRVISLCESCLDSVSATIKRYKRNLKTKKDDKLFSEKECDIIEVGDKE